MQAKSNLSRNIVAAAIAVLATIALHGTWLSEVNADAIAAKAMVRA